MVLRGRLEIITCRIETIGLTSLFLKEICDIKIVNMLKEVIPLGVFLCFFLSIQVHDFVCCCCSGIVAGQDNRYTNVGRIIRVIIIKNQNFPIVII